MAAATDNTYLLSQGKVYLASRVANGAQNGGYVWVGDVDQFSIDTTQKFDDIEESYTGNRFVAAHAPNGASMATKFNFLQISTANLTKAYLGTYGGAVTGSTVSAEPVTLYKGQMMPLAHPGVSSVVVTKVAGTVVLTLATDYTVDAVNGTITATSTTSAISTSGTPCTIAYTYGDYTGKVQAFMANTAEYAVRVEGLNTMNGNAPFLANIKRLVLDMPKTFSLIENKHTMLQVGGMLLPDSTVGAGLSQWFEIVKA